MTLKPWPFLYSVDLKVGGLVTNNGFCRVAGSAGVAAPLPDSLRGDLVARGIKPSGPLPKRIQKAATAKAPTKRAASGRRKARATDP